MDFSTAHPLKTRKLQNCPTFKIKYKYKKYDWNCNPKKTKQNKTNNPLARLSKFLSIHGIIRNVPK